MAARGPLRECRHYQVYLQDRSLKYGSFHSRITIDLHVAFRDGHLDIAFADKRWPADLEPKYLRHLYILSWADSFPPARVPIEFTRL